WDIEHGQRRGLHGGPLPPWVSRARGSLCDGLLWLCCSVRNRIRPIRPCAPSRLGSGAPRGGHDNKYLGGQQSSGSTHGCPGEQAHSRGSLRKRRRADRIHRHVRTCLPHAHHDLCPLCPGHLGSSALVDPSFCLEECPRRFAHRRARTQCSFGGERAACFPFWSYVRSRTCARLSPRLKQYGSPSERAPVPRAVPAGGGAHPRKLARARDPWTTLHLRGTQSERGAQEPHYQLALGRATPFGPPLQPGLGRPPSSFCLPRAPTTHGASLA